MSGMAKLIQAKDLDDRAVLQLVADLQKHQGRWTLIDDLADDFGVPWKVALAKARGLIKRGLLSGCGCGCRGDLVLTASGRDFLAGPEPRKLMTMLMMTQVD